MAWNKLIKSLGFFLDPHRLLIAIRIPKQAIFGYLFPILKYPKLFYKTINVEGLITPEVGVILYEAVLRTKNKSSNIIEVGVYKGLSTLYLAEVAKRVKKRVKSFDTFSGLSAVDPVLDSIFMVNAVASDVSEGESNLRKNNVREIVDLTIGDARKTMLPTLNDNGFVVAFLDVDTYEITHDLLFQLRRVTTGGEVIFIHDAFSPGIKKAINEFQTLWRHPVKEQYLADGSTAKLTIPFD